MRYKCDECKSGQGPCVFDCPSMANGDSPISCSVGDAKWTPVNEKLEEAIKSLEDVNQVAGDVPVDDFVVDIRDAIEILTDALSGGE